MSSDEHAVFRLVTYNVQCGIGEDRVYDPSRIGKWLSEQPVLDVVCCQEIELNDEGQPHQSVRMGVMHNDNQPKVLADALGWNTGRHFVVKKLMRREQLNRTAPPKQARAPHEPYFPSPRSSYKIYHPKTRSDAGASSRRKIWVGMFNHDQARSPATRHYPDTSPKFNLKRVSVI